MRGFLSLIAGCSFLFMASPAFSGSLGRDVPVIKSNGQHEMDSDEYEIPNWWFSPVATIPGLKLKKSEKSNTEYDTTVLAGVGGGISLNHIFVDNNEKDVRDKVKSDFSLSLIAIVNTLEKENKQQTLNTSVAVTIGLLNNTFLLGVGRDLGEISGAERTFLLIGFGTNFLNGKEK